MSSHHIIRDEQEPPALVFEIHQNWEELEDLLGWSPILLIKPELEELFQSKQTKIDGYLLEEELNRDAFLTDLVYSDRRLSKSLLQWINVKNCTAVNIFCDNELMMQLFRELEGKELAVPLIFFTELGKCILKSSSNFKKWYPSQFKIDILNEDVKSIRNLKKAGGIYAVEKEGFVYIEVNNDLVLINEKDFRSCK